MISPTIHKSFSIGTPKFVDKMFSELNMNAIISPLKMKGVNIFSLVRGMTTYKLMDNFSIAKCHEWLTQPELLEYYGIKPFCSKTLYRALETLGESFGEIMRGIQNYLFSHFDFTSTDEYLDWTSIILWGEKAELGEHGYSRDHRPDKKQIMIGISELAKPYDIPIGMTIRAGNVNDQVHFKSTFIQTARYLKPGSLATFDQGANSQDNLDLIEGVGHEYLTSMKMNESLDKRFKRFWEDNPECINPEEDDETKRIYGIKVKYPHSVNYLYYTRERENLCVLSRRKTIIKQLNVARECEDCQRRKKKMPKKVKPADNMFLDLRCSFQTHIGNKDDDEIVDEKLAEMRTCRDGFFALKSSKDLTLKEALDIYRAKDSVEKIFHSLKSEIEIKPLRVWTDASIRGALLIGFIAQLIVSLAKYLIPEAKRVSTKFILKALENLTVTVIKGETAFKRYVYSNFDHLNTAILGIDDRRQAGKVGG